MGTGFKLKVLAMTFKTDGFLSPTMEEFRTSLRKVPAYKLWLEFAEELNRLGWDMLEDHETPTTDNQRLIISVLFIRAHQSFQAAITLVERGMLADARVVVRSGVEGAMALNVLANDATFDMQLIEAHLHNQRRTARIVLNTPEYRSGYAATEIAQLKMLPTRRLPLAGNLATSDGRPWLQNTVATCTTSFIARYQTMGHIPTSTRSTAFSNLTGPAS